MSRATSYSTQASPCRLSIDYRLLIPSAALRAGFAQRAAKKSAFLAVFAKKDRIIMVLIR
jgi:hypothetical protein